MATARRGGGSGTAAAITPASIWTARRGPLDPGVYTRAVEHDGRCIGSAGLRVDPDQHYATYTVGLFVARLRGRGLGQQITRLAVSWAFGQLRAHRIQLKVLASNTRAINCYLACGFRQQGIRREATLYPDGWKDLILMGVLQSEYASQPEAAPGDLRSGQHARGGP